MMDSGPGDWLKNNLPIKVLGLGSWCFRGNPLFYQNRLTGMDPFDFPELRLDSEFHQPGCARSTAGVLGVLLGAFGVHRFYLGYRWTPLLQCILTVISGGLAGFWGTCEGLMILTGRMRCDAQGRPLQSACLAYVPAACPRVAMTKYQHSRTSPWFMTLMIFFFPLSNSLVLAAIWTLSGWSLPGFLGQVPDLIPPPGGEHWVVAEPPLALVVEMLEAEVVDQEEITFELSPPAWQADAASPLSVASLSHASRVPRLPISIEESLPQPVLTVVPTAVMVDPLQRLPARAMQPPESRLPRLSEGFREQEKLATQRFSTKQKLQVSRLVRQVPQQPTSGGAVVTPGVAQQPLVRPVYNPSPDYPEQALRQGQEGLVKIRVLVAADGTVRSARLHASSGHVALDTAALRVVRQWRFMLTAKKPVKKPVDVIVPIRFRIESR